MIRREQRGEIKLNVLVIDVGGSHVKILATGHQKVRKLASGSKLTAEQMVAGVQALAHGWKYDVVALGYPGTVAHNQPTAEPRNLGTGWVDFDYEAALQCPVRMINDAAMQALGAYNGGRMLFLGFGTGLGTTLIVDGVIVAMRNLRIYRTRRKRSSTMSAMLRSRVMARANGAPE